MQKESLEIIFRALQDANVQYLVVGGLAVAAHGYLRLTGDVDLVIGLEPSNIVRGLTALEHVGFRMAIPVTAEQFADPEQRESWRREKGMLVLKLWSDAHRRTPIDVFVYEPFDFADEWQRAPRFEWGEGLHVPVVSLPTLLAMKREAGRPQDLADIDALEGGAT